MDMEKSASRFKFFDTAKEFGCIFFVKMNVRHIAFKQRKKGRCNMPYLSIRAQKTPPDYITRNIVISSDGVFCALIDKDENKAKVEHNKTKSKRMKFCRVLEAGCTPYIDYRKLALM